MSIEEMDDDEYGQWPLPKIQIGEETSLSGIDIEDFASLGGAVQKKSDDLLMSGEFEEL
jgi:hypothetical protein